MCVINYLGQINLTDIYIHLKEQASLFKNNMVHASLCYEVLSQNTDLSGC